MEKQSYYLLTPDIALRSWHLLPRAYYIKGQRYAMVLIQEDFMLLLQCDGKHALEDSEGLQKLTKWGLCAPCKYGAVLTDWQKPMLCENRFFPSINWEITGKCNYHCLHCFNAADHSPLREEFSWDECVRLMDEAQACGINCFTITGGEPMLHPHFMEILRGIHCRGMYVEELNTNGSLITAAILDEMKAFDCMPLMKISFDGLGHHDWLRGWKGAEETALSAIRLCVEKGFRVKVQTNVHRLNLASMLPTAELLEDMGVSEMRIIRTSESPRWIKNSEELCEGGACLSFEEYYDAMLELAYTYIKKTHRMQICVWQFLNIFPISRRYNYRPVACAEGEYRDSQPVCRSNRSMIGVTASGELVPCLQMSGYYDKHGIKLGNVKKRGLKGLLSGGAYLDTVCTCVGQLAEHNEKCQSCRWWKLCAGGCRAIGFTLTGDHLGEDKAKCAYFNGGYIEKTDAAFAGSGYLPLININTGGEKEREAMKEIRITESKMSEALAQIDTLEGLSPKDRGCLRLLTEEMFSMCRELLGADALDFEVKRDEGQYALRTSTKTRVDKTAREHFLSMSSSGKNAANQGIKGMLGAVLEVLSFEGNPELYGTAWAYGMHTTGGEYAYMWTLSQYMEFAPKEKVRSEWDGMEKSIIANFADDVSIGVRSGKLEMTVTKTFYFGGKENDDQ